jgi:hypothetical protein
VDDCEPDQQSTYCENALTFIVDEATRRVELGFRQDPRSGLKSLHERVEPPRTPSGGWTAGTVMIGGRPVLPLARAGASHGSVAARATRRGRSRERRSRATRRTATASRDGPSDESEGDPEQGASPDATQLNGQDVRRGRWT